MRCPVCRAENNEGPHCRRCRADLSLLFQMEDQRSALLQMAQEEANAGNWPEVMRLADQAHALRSGEDSQRLIAIGNLMSGEFALAWNSYQKES